MNPATPVTKQNEECDICMYPIYSSCQLKCCKKPIHKSCLLKWAITKQSDELTCPFCRAHIVDIFECISLAQISQMLVDWECDHNIIVRGKKIQIIMDANPVDLINRTNDAQLIEETGRAPSRAQQTLPVRYQSTTTTTTTTTAVNTSTNDNNGSDKALFWCFMSSIIAIIIIMVVIIIVTSL